MSPLLCSIPEAAKALNVGRSTIYDLLNDRSIVSVKIGQRRLVVVDTVRAYVATLVEAA